MAWEIFIIIVALYSSLVIPIKIGININLLDPSYNIIDLITWFIYFTDVFVNVRTTYIDNDGLEVTESRKIAKKYIASMRFYIDILSLLNVPNTFLEDVGSSTKLALNMFGLLKISRYLRMQNLIV